MAQPPSGFLAPHTVKRRFERARARGPAGTSERVERSSELVSDVGRIRDAGLEREVLTNWGERWPAWRMFWTMISHDLHHGGEIGVPRDLNSARVART